MTIHSLREVLEALRRFTEQDEADSPQARTRARLLAAAAAAFERQGYRRASVAEIAQDAAVAKGTVYLYFPSKADLLLHVLMWERRRLYERLAPTLAEAPNPRARLRALLRDALLHADLMPVSNRLKEGDPELMAALREVDAGALRASLALFAAIFRWLLSEAAPCLCEPALGERAAALMATLQAVPAMLRARGALSVERFAEITADILVDGALSPPPPTLEA